MDHIAMPLLGFNVGIEAGQIVVLLAAAVVFFGADAALRALPRRQGWPDAFQLRLITVSAAITLVASGWAVERFPR